MADNPGRLSENLAIIRGKIEQTVIKTGKAQEVSLVAVTKTIPVEIIQKAIALGVTQIGENRVQESEQKFSKKPIFGGVTKRFIGHLQSNKAVRMLDLFDTIDSIDSLKLANRINVLAIDRNKLIPVLLEVNTSGEQQKFGFSPTITDEMLACFELQNITIEGLMTVGPMTKEEAEIRHAFKSLKKVMDSLNYQLKPDKKITTLSMGMSNDYEIAIEEGSTMVRIGTALFGKR